MILEGEKSLTFPLSLREVKDNYDIFSGELSLTHAGLYFYCFHIEDARGSFDLYKQGYNDTNMCAGDKWQVTCIPRGYTTPDEFKGRVMYQIFPDRFSKDGECDLRDKLTPFILHESTEDVPVFRPDSHGEILNNDFYGGNLKGICNELEYLKALGVGVIYLNPIFKAYSNHRYDTCDYKKPDPMLGTKEDFISLCDKAHSMGIKIILDGVFSHTGSDSIYFDIKNRYGSGAFHNPNSPYRSWYNLGSDGGYACWWGIPTLPCVNELDESYLDYIITGDDSVIKHWLSLGADGFRLDVADELPDRFISLLRTEVKRISEDAIVLGEVWEDASNKIAYGIRRRYFSDCELDSVMNYPFREAVIGLVTHVITTEEFANKIMTITENYPKEVTHCLMNSLSTHDTPRIMTVLSGAPLNMSREDAYAYKLTNEQKISAKERIYPAVMLQFFLPGCACIYYGDESGAYGFGDPFNRGYFDRAGTDEEILDFYKAMCKVKNSFGVFKDGEISFLKCDAGSLIMKRTSGRDSVCAAVNLSDTPLEVNALSGILSHNAEAVGDTFRIQKYGFLIY